MNRREENMVAGNRNATIQRVTAGARSDGTLTALGGEYFCALGWSGWLPSTAGPMQMLHACENVRTVEYGAKLNLPPMAAFRAPGFVEGTWSLECLLDKLAAELDLDPLEVRRLNYANADPLDGRPYSGKNLMECYRRAEPYWERRTDVRARSDDTWKRGVGLASQIWYGGGGPPSYAWVRVGSDGRVNVVTAMQDIGTGTRTAMAQIAAEELGLPLDRVEVQVGDSARGPFAVISGGSSTLPSMGPAVRAAAADAGRQILEIAAQRFDVEQRVLSLAGGNIVSADGGSWPLEEITGLLQDGQILGKGARGPNPTGLRVLTFGVQVAEVAVDVETGEVVVEQIYAVHDVGRVINPLGARSQIEGGIIQAMGHTFSEVRLDDPRTRDDPHAHARRVQAADDRRRAGDHLRARRRSGRAPDEPRVEGSRRAADHPDCRGDRERDPRRDRRRRDVAADHARGDPAGPPRSTRARTRCSWFGLARSRSSRRSAANRETRRWREARSSCRSCATGSCTPNGSSRSRTSCRAACGERRSAPARRSRSSSTTRPSPTRCVRPVGSQPRRSFGTWGRSAATCCSRRAAGTGACSFPADCTAATSATRAPASIASTRSSRTTSAPRHIRRTLPPRSLRSARRVRTDRRELPLDLLYRLPTADDRSLTTLEDGELILELEFETPLASTYLKAMDRKRWAFALVGFAAARYEDGVRLALAGVAPIPWALDSLDALEAAEPLPGNAYKVELAQALGRRAIASITR